MTKGLLDEKIFSQSVHEMLDDVLRYAAAGRISDVHIEPLDNCVRIRLRRDGVLFVGGYVKKEKMDTVTARIKIMAGLDIANKRMPQDGRFLWNYGGRSVDMRVSVMPTIRGEKTVVRLLDAGQIKLDLNCLGLGDAVISKLRRLAGCSKGLFIYSGATGSGKTTTLYAVLKELHKESVSIATLEDPVEYKLEGLCQSQISVKGGLEFQKGLRALLRQDPDILIIGEIRDVETARIAVQAALTGHLVFTTIHAASAAEVPIRLMDMGIESFLLADALIGITSQVLVRRLCIHCRREAEEAESARGFQHVGCSHCYHSGYDGRFCLCEIVAVGPRVKNAIRKGVSAAEIETAALADGAIFMGELIRQAVSSGKTDMAEIRRVYNVGDEP